MSNDCERCAKLRDELAFERDMRKLAQSAVATIADLDEVAPALRQILRTEIARRERAEHEADILAYKVEELQAEVKRAYGQGRDDEAAGLNLPKL